MQIHPILALTLLPRVLSNPITNRATNEKEMHELNVKYPIWNFNLFHDKHCQGTTVSYAGQGSSGCRINLEAGGETFIKVNIKTRCKLVLYKDEKCSHRAKIEEITARSKNKCQGISRQKAVRGFEILC